MSGVLANLAIRRENLQRKAAEQRRDLGKYVGDIEARCLGVDRGFLRVKGLLQKPVLLAAGAALFYFLGPARLMSLAGKTAAVVSIARRFFRRAS
jgi:hypothetical protein